MYHKRLVTHSFMEQSILSSEIALPWKSFTVVFLSFSLCPAVWLFVLFFFHLIYTNIFFLPTSQHILGQITEQFQKYESSHSFKGLDRNRLWKSTTFDLYSASWTTRDLPTGDVCSEVLNRCGNFCRPMQQYWGQLCEQYDEQELGHMV